jgi:acyl carrier protein
MSKLHNIFAEVFKVKESDYTDETEVVSFKEWDSMAHMLLITRIEDVYNIQLDGDDIAIMRTIGQFKQVLQKHSVTDL